MEQSLSLMHGLLEVLALPQVGLPAVFLASLVAASLIPMAAEPVVFGYVALSPEMFWPGVLAASAGSILGGVSLYATGWAVRRAIDRWNRRRDRDGADVPRATVVPGLAGRILARHIKGRWARHAQAWVDRLGPSALLLCWVPGIGDPLCLVAGWLRLGFWPSLACMIAAKFLRTLILTIFLLWAAGSLSGYV